MKKTAVGAESILEIPEIRALDGPAQLIRIPNQIDVPVTDRLMRLIDSPEFQRLKRISQLGMVSSVYPAATHSRFEHSLGVYRMGLLFLRQFATQERFTEVVSAHDATVLIVAALLHDIGHWPYCHPIEDIRIDGIPSHENFAAQYISRDSIANCLRDDWGISPREVIDVINRNSHSSTPAILQSILAGPIDIDKMDYLYRDSLHAGVPYGQNFDALRLIRSLCLSQNGERLAITSKGRTAAELMVFARYVMFSEVYWHHAVRSATAMFQRAFYLWHQQHQNETDFDQLVQQIFELSEWDLINRLQADCDGTAAGKLLLQLFGPARQLYKRVANYSCNENEAIYRGISQRPYLWLLQRSNRLARLISDALGRNVVEESVLIDAPPVGLEVQFEVQVLNRKTGAYRDFGDVSPVVHTLARQQFDDFVKQVRIFVHPDLANDVAQLDMDQLVQQAIADS